MAGILVVKPNVILSLKDGVVVVQSGYEVFYIRTDEYDADELKVGFE